jgi:hypothetical protein
MIIPNAKSLPDGTPWPEGSVPVHSEFDNPEACCLADENDWTCTMEKGHDGWHVAHGYAEGMHTWKDSAQ